MKPLGITRTVDGLGRVVIPKEFRRALGIQANDAVEIFATEHGVFMRPYEPGKPAPTAKKIEGVEL